MNWKILAVFLTLLACSNAGATEFNKTNQALSITVIQYEDKSALLESYNSNPATSNPITNGDGIDAYALYSVTGSTCIIHAFRNKRSKSYENSLGHELRHCLEGQFH